MITKIYRRILAVAILLLTSIFLPGCAGTDHTVTSPYHPGPVVGKAVGTGVGVVAGNVVGVGVGAVEGTVQGLAAPFDPSYRMVRHWRTETTADGRTIQVPYDVLVNQNGEPVNMPAPTGNPPPPSGNVAAAPVK